MELQFYPPRYWGLDPVFSSKAKLNVCDIHSLQYYPDLQDVHCILNHPIMNVHIMGDVVSIVRKTRLITYEVDDGTAVIACCQWRKAEDSDENLFIPKLGQLISVFGKVSEFREEKQLTVSTICPEEDPNVEPLFWLEVAHLKKMVYLKPFVIPAGVPETPMTSTESCLSLYEALLSKFQQCLENIFVSRNFTLEELKVDEDLLQACFETIKTVFPNISKNDVFEQLHFIVMKLPLEGLVVPVIGVTRKHSRDPVYKIFSEERDLFPLILSYLSKREENPRVAKLGVPEKWIVEHVKQKEIFSQLPNAKIVASLNSLVEKSQIYPVGPKSYRRVL